MTPAIGQAAVSPGGPVPVRTRSPAAALACEAAPPPAHGQLPPNPLGDHRARAGTYARTDLGPEPAAAARARRLTRDTLARWEMRHLTDDAQAIASELAANAINAAIPPHGTLPAIIFAVHSRPDELRIIVWDNGPGRPLPAAPGLYAETGRGLAIIDHLTGGNWGWWPTPQSGGKVVWAALSAVTGSGGEEEEEEEDSPC
jgi:hypothetical protein